MVDSGRDVGSRNSGRTRQLPTYELKEQNSRLEKVRDEMIAWEEHKLLEEQQKARFTQSRIPSGILSNIFMIGGFYRFFTWEMRTNRRSAFMKLPLYVAAFLSIFTAVNAYTLFGVRILNFNSLFNKQDAQVQGELDRQNDNFKEELRLSSDRLSRQYEYQREHSRDYTIRMLKRDGYSDETI